MFTTDPEAAWPDPEDSRRFGSSIAWKPYLEDNTNRPIGERQSFAEWHAERFPQCDLPRTIAAAR